jgi:hypothetical protein
MSRNDKILYFPGDEIISDKDLIWFDNKWTRNNKGIA